MTLTQLKELAHSHDIEAYIDYGDNTLCLCLDDDEPDVVVSTEKELMIA